MVIFILCVYLCLWGELYFKQVLTFEYFKCELHFYKHSVLRGCIMEIDISFGGNVNRLLLLLNCTLKRDAKSKVIPISVLRPFIDDMFYNCFPDELIDLQLLYCTDRDTAFSG